MRKFSQQSIGLYKDKEAKNYYKIVQDDAKEEMAGVDANVFTYLKEILPKNVRGKIVLDIGCGDGRWSQYMHGLGAQRIIGLDNSQDMIDLAEQRKKDTGMDRLEFVKQDMRNMPFDNESIDLALSIFSLVYFKDLEEIIGEIFRVLKKGGALFVATNVISADSPALLEKLKGESYPIILGAGSEKIRLENVIQSSGQYEEAFSKARLILLHKKYFTPQGVSISPDYKYKDRMIIKKAVFSLSKLSG